jgi:hypothetical protein
MTSDLQCSNDIIFLSLNKIMKNLAIEPISQLFKSKKYAFSYQNSDNNNFKEENIEKLNSLKKDLQNCKTIVEKYYLGIPDAFLSTIESNKISKNLIPENFSPLMTILDPFRNFKYQIMNTYFAQDVTSTWFKYWEILKEFNLIPNYKNDETFFICESSKDLQTTQTSISSINHFIKTQKNIKSLVWYSLLPNSKENSNTYQNKPINICKNYPKNFITDSDITQHFEPCDIFLSHASLPNLEKQNYNNQELDFLPILKEQFDISMQRIKKGGNLIMKTFSFFETETIDIFYSCFQMFEKFYIYKPFSSKITNSEIFIIGINYTFNDNNIEKETDGSSSSTSNIVPSWFLEQLVNTASEIYREQIIALHYITNMYDKIIHQVCELNLDNNTQKILLSNICKEVKSIFKAEHIKITDNWIKYYPISSLKSKDKLRI